MKATFHSIALIYHILQGVIPQVIKKGINTFGVLFFLEQVVGVGPAVGFGYRLIIVGIPPKADAASRNSAV